MIDPTKTYKTRSGLTVIRLQTNGFSKMFPFTGYVAGKDGEEYIRWQQTGAAGHKIHGDRCPDMDLVEVSE